MGRIFAIASMFLLVACQPLSEMQNNNIVTAVGFASISDQRGTTEDEKKIRAMRASKLDAYRELTEQIYGLRLSARADMTDQQLGTEFTDGAVDGVIRGAQVVRSYVVGDNYVTEMSLDLDMMDRLKDNAEVHSIPQNSVTMF
ncbi:LPP20 family lipoprotein [Thaumasiovibrio subtropicus]|uniref:LPP20 family lipoprotein n=1 Tax=Thaumasiovibrio subtropicus TaxID=1891207 RepID=UPI000B35C067|nr:LPP20 family lipoprotein [Thaumasiovibrio subtropicus]